MSQSNQLKELKVPQQRVLHQLKVLQLSLIKRRLLHKIQVKSLMKRIRDHYQNQINMLTMKLDPSCFTTRVIDLSILIVTSQLKPDRDQSKKRRLWLNKDRRKENKLSLKSSKSSKEENIRRNNVRNLEKPLLKVILKVREINIRRG
jgi:hypothetical protein